MGEYDDPEIRGRYNEPKIRARAYQLAGHVSRAIKEAKRYEALERDSRSDHTKDGRKKREGEL